MSIEVSVVIPTYNHENYVEVAINSVLMQKINFDMEVLIGEDCSTDGTRNVLKNLEPSLPDNYYIFYREHNLCDGNFADLYSRMRGKYFIILEGDDYWTYAYKLQEEYDFLQRNPNYTAVAHNTQVVNEKGKPVHWNCHECLKSEYTIQDFQKGIFPGQTATILRRNYYRDNLFDYNINIPGFPGDRIKAFLMVANGKVYCIQKKWSAYRLVLTHGSSFSANFKYSYEKKLKFYYDIYKYSLKHNVKQDVICVTEEMYYWYLFACVIKKQCNVDWQSFVKTFNTAQNKLNVICYILKKICILPYTKISNYIDETKKFKAINRRDN